MSELGGSSNPRDFPAAVISAQGGVNNHRANNCWTPDPLFPDKTALTWDLMKALKCCATCWDLLHAPPKNADERVRVRWAELVGSRDGGCQFCGFLCQAIAFVGADVPRPQSHTPFRYTGNKVVDYLRESWRRLGRENGPCSYVLILDSPRNISIYENGTRNKLCCLSLVEIASGAQLEPQTDSQRKSPQSGLPLSSKTLNFIRSQFVNCISNPGHDCLPHPSRTNARWPARVVKVGAEAISLVDFDPDTMGGGFAALSYPWGSAADLEHNPPYLALASTLDDLRAGISVTRLPLTIRHAVSLCVILEIGYLWVDSLCIIQDSPNDWEIEASKMETVYSASKLTIIAAAAKSCHDGISESTPPDSISLFLSTEPVFQVIARKPARSGYHQRRYNMIVADTLATRGWAYQEEFLSSRYMKIATDDVQWKCQVGASCICGESPAEQTEPTAETVTMLETWEDIVEDFSRRSLTVETDRLVAFSGIARRFAPIFDDAVEGDESSYVAGLWRSDLVKQLQWVSMAPYLDDEKGFYKPSCFVAPTFSWASVPGVLYPKRPMVRDGVRVQFESLCDVLDVGTKLEAINNRFGKVSSGSVILRGPVIPCIVEPAKPREGQYSSSSYSYHVEVHKVLPELMSVDTSFYPDYHTSEVTTVGGETILQRKTSQSEPKPSGEKRASILLLTRYNLSRVYIGVIITPQIGTDGYQRLGHIRITASDEITSDDTSILEPWMRDITLY